MGQQYKYFAFISYSSKDTEWGKRLQKKLEHYQMPATLCNERGWKRNPMNPVFFAPTDIQPGGLTEELQERLKASRNLIVICSPNSAKSQWVGREIEFFHQLGRTKNIHFFIVDGIPHSGDPETECFNPMVEKLGLPEILGANIHEKNFRWPWLNKERAYVQLISKLLEVEFDAIWQRHRRQLIRKTIAWSLGSLAVLATLVSVWVMNQPMDVQVRLNETSVHNENLPPLKDAVVTIALENKTEEDTIRTMDGEVVFTNIPHHFLNKKVHVTVVCRDFIPVDTTVALTQTIVLNIARDPEVFGNIHFYIYDRTAEKYISDVSVNIDGHIVSSDSDGLISLTLPLELQRKVYSFSSSIPLHQNYIPMPCGKRDCMYYR